MWEKVYNLLILKKGKLLKRIYYVTLFCKKVNYILIYMIDIWNVKQITWDLVIHVSTKGYEFAYNDHNCGMGSGSMGEEILFTYSFLLLGIQWAFCL